MPLAARVSLLVVLVALGMAAFAALVAIRAYRVERLGLLPRRLPLSLPSAPELTALEAVSLSGGEGAVRAWFLAPRNGALVLLVHGLGGDRAELVPQARLLARHGYGLVLPDLPGHGESAGHVSGGATDRAALESALALALARAPGARIGAYGFSYGACVVLELAAREPALRALVLEGAPSDLEAQLAWEYRAWGWPARLGARLALRQAGFDLRGSRPLAAIARGTPRPVLLIAGLEDATVPPAMVQALYAAAPEPRELWVVAGAGHGDAARLAPAEYERRLRQFFDRHLLAADAGGST